MAVCATEISHANLMQDWIRLRAQILGLAYRSQKPRLNPLTHLVVGSGAVPLPPFLQIMCEPIGLAGMPLADDLDDHHDGYDKTGGPDHR